MLLTSDSPFVPRRSWKCDRNRSFSFPTDDPSIVGVGANGVHVIAVDCYVVIVRSTVTRLKPLHDRYLTRDRSLSSGRCYHRNCDFFVSIVVLDDPIDSTTNPFSNLLTIYLSQYLRFDTVTPKDLSGVFSIRPQSSSIGAVAKRLPSVGCPTCIGRLPISVVSYRDHGCNGPW